MTWILTNENVTKFPRGLREGIWRLRRSLARSRIPPATQATKQKF